MLEHIKDLDPKIHCMLCGLSASFVVWCILFILHHSCATHTTTHTHKNMEDTIDEARSYAEVRAMRKGGSRPMSSIVFIREFVALDRSISSLLILCAPLLAKAKGTWLTKDCLRLLQVFLTPTFRLEIKYNPGKQKFEWVDVNGTNYSKDIHEASVMLKSTKIDSLGVYYFEGAAFGIPDVSEWNITEFVFWLESTVNLSDPYYPEGVKCIHVMYLVDPAITTITGGPWHTVTRQFHMGHQSNDDSIHHACFPNTRLYVSNSVSSVPDDQSLCYVHFRGDGLKNFIVHKDHVRRFLELNITVLDIHCIDPPNEYGTQMICSHIYHGSLTLNRDYVAQFVRDHPSVTYLKIHGVSERDEMDIIEYALEANEQYFK